MPELPEIETLCRQLQPLILNKQICGFEILDSMLKNIGRLDGKTITSVVRHGKFLKMELDNNAVIVLHLRMTGRFRWDPDEGALPPHTRFFMTFPHGRLLCIDPRRFATLSLRDSLHYDNSAIDPSRNYPLSALRKLAGVRRCPAKAFLMDQRIIAGIGNIYACEILHEVMINPWRQTCGVSKQEWKRISTTMRAVLSRAVECRGTSVSDWRDLFGNKGEYQHELKVYGREGLPCPRCHGTIQRLRLNGRGTYFCPSCQA